MFRRVKALMKNATGAPFLGSEFEIATSGAFVSTVMVTAFSNSDFSELKGSTSRAGQL